MGYSDINDGERTLNKIDKKAINRLLTEYVFINCEDESYFSHWHEATVDGVCGATCKTFYVLDKVEYTMNCDKTTKCNG